MVTKVWNSGLVLSVRSATTEFNDRYNGCSLTMCQLHMVMLLSSLDVVLNQTTQQNSCGMKIEEAIYLCFHFPLFLIIPLFTWFLSLNVTFVILNFFYFSFYVCSYILI